MSAPKQEPRPRREPGFATVRELAERLGISRARVLQLEQRALDKLRRHPVIRALAEEFGISEE